uniref:NAD-dependent epimerase/dehydratase family protein n=1 Tax=Flavobacterium sp. TaxID=239 RepID=UPI00404B169B
MEKVREKILILGGVGMLGHVLLNKLNESKAFEVYDITRNNEERVNNFDCDVTNFNSLFEIIKKIKPKYIINCIGVLINGSIQDPSNAILSLFI